MFYNCLNWHYHSIKKQDNVVFSFLVQKCGDIFYKLHFLQSFSFGFGQWADRVT
jgi:hypothetical protein